MWDNNCTHMGRCCFFTGGLKDSQVATDEPTSVVMKGPGYYGVPPKGKAGAINRREVTKQFEFSGPNILLCRCSAVSAQQYAC
jgi:hypothetical protein